MAFLLAVSIGVGGSFGCGRAVNRAAERHIRDLLPNMLGEARIYRVHVAGDELGTSHGKLDSVEIDGEDVQLSGGLLIDRLKVSLHKVDADLDHRKLRSIGSATFTATISSKTLDEYLAGESPEDERIRNAHVTLRNGEVTLSAERVVLGAGVPFRIYGPLKVIGPHRIELDPNKLVVVGVPITGVPLRFLKRKFESAIDLSGLGVPMVLESVRTENGKLILSGLPDISAMLKAHAREEGER